MAVQELRAAYHNIFAEFLGDPLARRLRLLPISGGISTGHLRKFTHDITIQAIIEGYLLLNETQKTQMNDRRIDRTGSPGCWRGIHPRHARPPATATCAGTNGV